MRGKNNIRGWMGEEELDFLYDIAKDLTVIELGSYLGRSAVTLAESAKKVWAVDPWNGQEVGNLVMDGTEYDQFKENTKDFDNIQVRKQSSLDFAKEFKGKVDMVFIDANHSYASVRADIIAWLPKTKKVICGHDYDFPDVKKAVDELFEIDGLVGSIWRKWL